MCRALVGSPGTQLGLLGGKPLGGLGQDSGVDSLGCSSRGVWRTLNNRLRTGTDKGNLTV